MSALEIFAYAYLVIGIFYVVAMSFAAYLAIKYNLPLFGMSAPPPIPRPPLLREDRE